MKKDILSQVGLTLTAISVLSFALGCVIINIHLSKYSITDFELIKPRAVFVGAIFLLYMGLNMGAYFLLISREELNKNLFGHLLLTLVPMGIYLTTLQFLLFDSDHSDPIYKLHIFRNRIDILPHWTFLFGLFGAMFILGTSFKNNFMKVCKFIAFIPILLLSSLFWNNLIFTSFFTMHVALSFGIGWFVVIYHIKEKAYNEREINKVRDENDEETEQIEVSQSELQVRLKENEIAIEHSKQQQVFMKTFFLLLTILIVFIFTAIYSAVVYPQFDTVAGGGKLNNASYLVNDKVVKGKKVHETDKFVFILEDRKSIRKLDWGEIDKVLLD